MCLVICLSVYLSDYLSVCLVVCLSGCLSVRVCLSGWLSVCLSVCLVICLSIHLSFYLSVWLSVHLSVNPSIYPLPAIQSRSNLAARCKHNAVMHVLPSFIWTSSFQHIVSNSRKVSSILQETQNSTYHVTSYIKAQTAAKCY